MNRIAAGFFLGAVAGAVGVFVYNLLDHRLAGWVTVGTLVGVVSQIPSLSKGRWFWWGVLGGAVVMGGWYLGRAMHYPMLAWPLLGAFLGVLCANGRLKQRIGGGALGFLAGLVGMHILPFITLVALPALGLPSTFAYDFEELGLVVAGGLIGAITAYLK